MAMTQIQSHLKEKKAKNKLNFAISSYVSINIFFPFSVTDHFPRISFPTVSL